jgi:enamine deaminase RidA (YjgF/YER057c/UK114 family)
MRTPPGSVVSGLVTMLMAAWPLGAAEVTYHAAAGHRSAAVVVRGADLAHTRQVMAVEAGDLADQTRAVLERLDAILRDSGSAIDRCVKLNVYVTDDAAGPTVEHLLGGAFAAERRPAMTCVTSALPEPGALVAIDAVAVVERAAAARTPQGAAERAPRDCAILPAGPRAYVSGQAERGDGSLADATAQTLASLGRTLDFLGLEKRDVVHVKSFLAPMADQATADRVIGAFFGDIPVPPRSVVEWTSDLPIEIELVVSAAGRPALADGPAVEVRTPPGMTAAPVFSRVTIARHPVSIYIGSVSPSDPGATPETQLRSMFRNLKGVLDLTGSDWMHLVKATYYVSDAELNRWHNEVRPDYFSPRRPPAASKAMVAGTGRPGHGISMDFIAVPGEP